ncbi:MAG: VCBS repeat-containing protein, partial [Anaerolineae bacterium]|nr:VCBS repeat-containing protein [Anaerolineae bacterium]
MRIKSTTIARALATGLTILVLLLTTLPITEAQQAVQPTQPLDHRLRTAVSGLSSSLSRQATGDAPLVSASESFTETQRACPTCHTDTPPLTYEQWRAAQPPQAPFASRQVLEQAADLAARDAAPQVFVVVNSSLYSHIAPSITQYQDDLIAAGYAVSIHTVSGGTPADLRALLQGELPNGLAGCLLVGDLPIPWYEWTHPDDPTTHQEFPIDVYYMDLDGKWLDADGDGILDGHVGGSGDIDLEIWVGRLTASTLSADMAEEIALVQNYFDKAHRYRTGALTLPFRALGYGTVDYYAPPYSLDRMFGANVNAQEARGQTSAADYLARLREGHYFVHLAAHSIGPTGHDLERGEVTSQDIRDTDPKAFFYNLFSCSNGLYVEEDYVAGHYVFAPSYGLAAVSASKPAGMIESHLFYQSLGSGNTLGVAFNDWYNELVKYGVDQGLIGWIYGMMLFGDPTLHVVDPEAPTASILSPEAHDVIHSITSIGGTALGTDFESYVLDYGASVDPSDWHVLAASTTPVNQGTLATWDTRDLNGAYALRLRVTAHGQTVEDRITLFVGNASIRLPAAGSALGPGTFGITGTATIHDFDHYTLAYGLGDQPASWSTAGITLAGGGVSEIADGPLATLDTTAIAQPYTYTLRLTVYSDSGEQHQDSIRVFIDPTFQAGWPQSVAHQLTAKAVSVGDIDGDGDLEIVAADSMYWFRAQVYAWHHDGTPVDGWPQQLNAHRLSTPALADVDGDGDLEIFVGLGEAWGWQGFTGVHAWHHDGTTVAGWWNITTEGPVQAAPMVGDIDGDGDLEIVAATGEGRVYAWEADGTPVAGWPRSESGRRLEPALSDLDGDGDLEIVAGADDGTVQAWHHDGTAASGWPVNTSSFGWTSAPVIGDIDGDGDPEVVCASETGRVFAWHHDGGRVSGWPRSTKWGWYANAPVLGDLDGNGNLEIVYISDRIYAWRSDGTSLSGWPVGFKPFEQPWATHSDYSAVLGDIDGDGDTEVIAGPDREGFVQAFHHNGATVSGWPRYAPQRAFQNEHTSPVLADVDRDGDVEVIAGLHDRIFAWDLDGAYDEDAVEWASFHADLFHTRQYRFDLPNMPPAIRDVRVEPAHLDPGETVAITARVSDQDGVSSVYAYIETTEAVPIGTVQLFDDGAHSDGSIGDGVYGNTWTTSATPRYYTVHILAIDTCAEFRYLEDAARFSTVDPPLVVIDDLLIDDHMNHDGVVNPGETVDYRLSLENVGESTAVDVTATIGTSAPYVYINHPAYLTFGDIPIGSTVTSHESNFFAVLPNCPDGYVIQFDLDINDANGNHWHYTVDITVIDTVGPAIYAVDVHPPYVEAGEAVTITAYATDSSGIGFVEAVIESPDETPVATVTLYDDGAHGDGAANDHFYGAIWTTDPVERYYLLDLTAEDGLGNMSTCNNYASFTTKPFSKTTDILFVAGNGQFNTAGLQQPHITALDTLDYSYDVWDTYLYGIPDGEALAQYGDGIVIWALPAAYEPPWQEIQSAIKAYLDGGGRLFLIG